MVISKNIVLIIVLFCLSSNYLKGQQRKDLLNMIASTEDVANLKLSPNGLWVGWQKSYDLKPDTLVLKGISGRKNLVYPHVKDFHFLSQNQVLLSYSNKTTWLNLNNNSYKTFPTKKFYLLEQGKYFAIVNSDRYKQNMSVYDSFSGSQLCEVDSFSDIFYWQDSQKMVFIQDKGYKNTVSLITNGSIRNLIEVEWKVLNAEISNDQKSLAIQTLDQKSTKHCVIYDLHNNEEVFNFNLDENKFSNVTCKYLNNGKWVLQFYISNKPQKKELVEVWYEGDKTLENDFAHQKTLKTLVDIPKKDMIILSKYSYSNVVPVGNNMVIGFDNTAFIDYIRHSVTAKMSLINMQDDSIQELPPLDYAVLNSSMDTMVGKLDGNWIIFFLGTSEIKKVPDLKFTAAAFHKDVILFISENKIYEYGIKSTKLKTLLELPDGRIKLLTKPAMVDGAGSFNFFQQKTSKPDEILFEATNNDNTETSLYSYNGNDFIQKWNIYNKSYRSLKNDSNNDNFVWIEENFNSPPQIMFKSGHNPVKVLYASNKNAYAIKKLKKQIFKYQVNGKILRGVLYFPKNYDPKKKYPIVVKIYENMSRFSNLFIVPTLKEDAGINVRNLVFQDYFVFLPDIIYDERGPGISALECVHSGLDIIAQIKSIDLNSAALFGFSFGGYETNYIATQSNRFKTFISGGALADTVNDYYSFNNHWKKINYNRYENFQMRHYTSFPDNKKKYFENNPIYFAERINKPMLLFTGKEDENIPWQNTRVMYSAARRNGTKVIALFYPNETHSISNPEAQTDLSIRVLDWLDHFLKNEEKGWILKKTKDAN